MKEITYLSISQIEEFEKKLHEEFEKVFFAKSKILSYKSSGLLDCDIANAVNAIDEELGKINYKISQSRKLLHVMRYIPNPIRRNSTPPTMDEADVAEIEKWISSTWDYPI